MKRALFTDTLRELRRSMGRFISIFAIIALGCGFFSGVKATMPDMTQTAEDYFMTQQLMDLRLLSSIGVKSDDVTAVRRAQNVESAAAGYSKDVFYRYDDQNCVLKVMSVPNETMAVMNKPVLLEGRMPEKSGECVVEVKMNSPATFRIGNTITFTSPDENESIFKSFTTDKFEIVGIVTSPLYIGYNREGTNIGNGEILSYVMVPESDFALDYYTELYVRFKDVSDLDPFSEEYSDAVAEKKREAVEAFHNSVSGRYEKLKSDAGIRISGGESDLATLESALAMSEADLQQLYVSSSAEYESAKKMYDELEDKGTAAAFLMAARLTKAETQLEVLRELAYGGSEAHDKYLARYNEGKKELEEAKAQLENVPDLKFYEQDRFSSSDYASFKNDADKIDAIAKVFPAFFILIVALVTLTTMTRMIDEQRTTIGTYKALGYSAGHIISKYLFYAFTASVLGSVLGVVIGLQVFPTIIYDSYKIMYNIPELETPFKLSYMLLCMAASIVCTGAAVLYASLKTLCSQPSELMRPKAPAAGRRVVLERIDFIWKRFGFLMKVTVRNLLRYKKRFFMTMAGVAGCTALIITGFGLKYSIKTVAEKQFGEILYYDALAVLSSSDPEASQKAAETLANNPDTDSSALFMMNSAEVRQNGTTQKVNFLVPQNADVLSEYINLEDVGGETYDTLPGDGVFITEKLSLLYGLKPGDSIELFPKDLPEVSVKVRAVVRNYAMHYAFMSPDLYREIFGSEARYNMAFLKISPDSENSFKEQLIKDKQFLGVTFKGASSSNFMKSVDSLDKIVLLLITCAAMLAFIVLYNLANINITERVREIATIKVLGFFDTETSAYIYRENIISCLLGIIIGMGLGKLLHYFVVITSEVDIVMFNRGLVWWAFLLGAVFTMVFAVLVNIVLHFKLKRIDMVESLKSVE